MTTSLVSESGRGTIIGNFKRLMTESGRRRFDVAQLLAVIVGVIQGLSLVALLPAATALSGGGTVWGLPLGGWLWVFGILAALSLAASYFQSIENFEAALDLLRTVHQAIGDHVAKLPLGWFRAGFAATASRLVSDSLMKVGEGVAHLISPVIIGATSGIILVLGVWAWNPAMGMVLTVAVPLYALIVILGSRCIRKGKAIVEPAHQELAIRVAEFASCQAALRAAGRATDVPPLRAAIADDERKSKTNLWYGIVGNLLDGVVTQVIIVGVIVLTGYLATSGTLGPIEAVVFIGIALRVNQVLAEVGAMVFGSEDKRQTLMAIDEVLDAPVLVEPVVSAKLTQPGQIEFDDVHFGYHSETPVLNGVSFTAAPRTMTALVGPSGSGKTTIARLVARFYDVDAGTVRVGGVDVRDQRTADLMAQLSMVFQDIYLFDDTLRANVLVGNPNASEAEVERAAELAGVSEIVRRLPEGWNSLVGEGGRALSGGERQRVSVARALLKGSPIVLFDEATSALDPENEANIVAAVEALRQNSTVLIIAHKLDTIRSADQIVVLDSAGHVSQLGTHKELSGQEGIYRDFLDGRERAQGWRLA